jgi:hypothetical protein
MSLLLLVVDRGIGRMTVVEDAGMLLLVHGRDCTVIDTLVVAKYIGRGCWALSIGRQ